MHSGGTEENGFTWDCEVIVDGVSIIEELAIVSNGCDNFTIGNHATKLTKLTGFSCFDGCVDAITSAYSEVN